jgi:hypothetical protein
MNYNIIAYTVYLFVIIYIILIVGNSLYKNGIGFLVNTFKGDADLANAVNKFLITAYYLINIGYSIYALKIWTRIITLEEFINVLSIKLGIIVLSLGLMHLFNVFTLVCIGNRKNKKII